MATTREVRVIINGEEFVSAAAKKAETGLSGFMNQIPGWAKAAAVLTAAYAAISKAVGMVSDFVMDSFAVYDAFAASQTKMAAQSKLTGVSLDDLKAAAAKAREEFGLSTATANEAAITTAKYASRAGDATLQNALLAASLDLGAAAGLTAAESMQAMEQGLRGQDEGFDKLLGKNPSTLWKEYADANGLAVGKMTDTQKRMAELTAVVDAGNIVQGAYNERLQTGAGQQEQMANKLDNAKIAFAAALQPIRMLVIQGLMKLIEVSTPVVQAVGEMVNWFGVKWALSLANARGNIGGLVEALGKLVRSDSMQAWGKAQVEAADKSRDAIFKLVTVVDKAPEAYKKHKVAAEGMSDEMKKALEKAAKEAEEFAERASKAVAKMFEDSKDAAIVASTKLRDSWGAGLTTSLDGASLAILKIRDALVKVQSTNAPEYTAQLTERTDGYLRTLNLMNDAHRVSIGLDNGLPKEEGVRRLQNIVNLLNDQAATEFLLTKNAGDYEKRNAVIEDLKKKILVLEGKIGDESLRGAAADEKRKEAIVRMANSVASIARGALDMAQAFGLADAEAASLLNSAINIGESIAKISGGDVFAGVSGLIGGVANIVSQMMAGDAERKRLLNQNNDRLRELRDGIGDLDLNVSGEDFSKASGALASIMPLIASHRGPGEIIAALGKMGVTMGDLSRIADELGINIKDKDGNIMLDLLPQLLQAMGSVEFGQFGTDFASQLRAAMSGFAINGTSETGQIGGLGALGAQFSPLLRSIFNPNDLAGSRVRLQEAFARMQSGGISAGELGGLTGNQFLEFITDLIGRIDRLAPGAGIGAGGEVTSGGGGTVDIPGVGLVPTSAGDAMVTALKLQTDTLAPLLETGNTFHMRTADNTESMRDTLLRIETFLQTFDLVGTVDASMERTRRANALERGIGLTY